MLTGSEYIKDSFLDHHDYEKMNPFMIPSFLQKGLVMSEGESWKRQRKFLGTAFTFEKLKSRLPMMNKVIEYISENDDTDTLHLLY